MTLPVGGTRCVTSAKPWAAGQKADDVRGSAVTGELDFPSSMHCWRCTGHSAARLWPRDGAWPPGGTRSKQGGSVVKVCPGAGASAGRCGELIKN